MFKSKKYDVAIIGGGLAGLTLAIQCSSAGFTTVLFEKEIYPFHKVCGEYISFESYPFLEKLGLSLNQMNLPAIKKLQLTDTTGNLYEFDLPLGGFGISRYTLDTMLYDVAVAEGVDVLTNTKVTDTDFKNGLFQIQTTNEPVFATVGAGTHGKRSNLDIKWKRSFALQKPDKLNNYIGVKYHIRYPILKDHIALHNFKNGYCGISAIENEKCCFCYLTTAGNLKANNNSIREMEKNVLWKNPSLKKIFTGAEFLFDEPLVISQISFAKKNQIENNVLMIGDAAGMITPLCGNGMSMAMHGSKIAFECIQKFLLRQVERDEMERQYVQQWKHHFSKRLFTGRVVQRLFGNNSSTSLFLKLMNNLPWLANKIISSTHGSIF